VHEIIALATNAYGQDQSTYSSAATSSFLVYLLVAVGMWPMLKKAGRPAWGGFVPIYNIYLQIKLAGRTGFLLLLYIIPIVNLITAIVVALGVARAFGKGPFYGFFLLFLFQPIGYLVLGFGSAKYTEIRR
jgi:hypothetical protein